MLRAIVVVKVITVQELMSQKGYRGFLFWVYGLRAC